MSNYDHRGGLAEFSRLETSTGGPDPQVEIIARAANTSDDEEAAWKIGCFIVPYSIGAAAGLWGNLRRDQVIEHLGLTTAFIRDNWVGFPTRRERRAVWKAEKFAESLRSYGMWARDELPKLQNSSYNEVWESVHKNIRYFGRYAAMKLIEALHRRELVKEGQPDMRPSGAWSPRKTLGLVFPEHAETQLAKGDSVGVLSWVNEVATQVKAMVERDAGIVLSWFSFETLLCNYRQALSGKYPGRSHDRELAHFLKAMDYWGAGLLEVIPFLQIRKDAFPLECLGELNGWDGARKDLESVFDEHGYFWCDTQFSYQRTEDLGRPAAW